MTSWNPASERLYGYSAEEAVGLSIATLLPPEVRHTMEKLGRTVRAGHAVRQHETQRLTKDGRRIEVSISISPIRDEAGAVVAAVAFTRDNTAHKDRERQLHEGRERLKEAQALAQLGSWDWDVRSNEVSWSDELHRVFGRPHATPTYEAFLETVHPDDVDTFTRTIEQSFAERTPFAFDYRIVRPDGAVRVVSARGRLVTDDAGQAIRVSGTAHDITDRDAVERMKNEFISVVSHELRTPLTSIRGSLGLLANGVLGPLPEKGQRMFDIAVRSTDRLVRLVGDILDLERIESDTEAKDKELVHAGDLMDEALHAVEATAQKASVTVSVSTSALRVEVVRDRIIQALVNLLSNAVKFSAPGSTVRLRAESSSEGVVFAVADEGRGIPPDRLAAIFERFQQVDSSDSRDKGGTGLGLAICRSIVRQHGGRIWVDSRVGAGSTFSFVLPVGDNREAAPAALRDPPAILPEAA